MTNAQAHEQAGAIGKVAGLIRALHASGEPVGRALAAVRSEWPFPVELLDDAVHRGYEELDGTAE
jgi:hypothetical protein